MPTSWVLRGPLASVEAARRATPRALHAAALDLLDTAEGVVTGDRSERLHEATETGPVTVAAVDLDRTGVTARLAVLVPSPDREVVLRLLAASASVGPAVETVEVAVRADGSPVDAVVEPERDRIVVDLGRAPDGPVVLGIDLAYDLPDEDELAAGGGPGGYGLLADHGDVVTLGHWLPAVVAIPGNAGPVPDWGDLGAFDVGTWVVDVDVESGTLRTGGVDRTTPDGRHRALGLGLRDLAGAWYPDGAPATVATTGPADAAVLASSTGGEAADAPMADLSGEQLASMRDLWGPLPWAELDVVRAPILPAAGMEFPGLVMMDANYWRPTDVDTEFTLAHEWGHQYAHALVGNGSLSDPVVDEPLAQYLSYRWFHGADGADAADEFARRTFADDFDMVREAPGQPAGDFTSGRAYSVAIYRTAADAWYRAAQDHGLAAVDDAVRTVVDTYALREATEDDLLDIVAEVDPAVGDDLRSAFDAPPA